MKRIALLITFLTCLAIPSVATPDIESTAREMPFSFEKGFVIVKAKIKGDVPVEVVLSTGAEHSTADMSLLSKYKLPSYYAGEPPVTGRNDRIYFFSPVSDVSVGGGKATSLSMRLSSTSELSKAVGREIFGVLGADFFKGRVVQFDFKKRMIRFPDQSSADVPQGNKSDAGAGGIVMLRMVESNDLLKQNLVMPVVKNVTFNGKEVKVLLDTGMVTVLALSSSVGKKLGFTIPPEKTAPRADKVALLRLGDYELTDVPVMLSAKGTSIDQSLGEYGAVAGSLFLQNFIVTFNFRSKVVFLEHA